MARYGPARLGQARLGTAWQGQVRFLADDLSTEGFGPLCWVLRNPDVAWKGEVGQCVAGLGLVWYGAAQCGNRCRRQHWGLRLPLLLSLESRCGAAKLGTAQRGWARPGVDRRVKDCRRQYGGFALPTVLSGTGMARLIVARRAWVRP